MVEFKRCLRSFANRFGLDLAPIHELNPEGVRLMALFQKLAIDCVLDVGANTGQTGRYLRRMGYQGRLVSFEPLSSAHAILLAEARNDPNWIIASRAAIGSKAGTLALNVSRCGVSSSFLPMTGTLLSAAPNARYVETEQVSVLTLDEAAIGYLEGRKAYLKIDTQGYEAEVLAGADAVLPYCVAAELEMSFHELYAGQPLFRDIWKMMEDRGFILWDLDPVLHGQNKELLQADGIFVRVEHPASGVECNHLIQELLAS